MEGRKTAAYYRDHSGYKAGDRGDDLQPGLSPQKTRQGGPIAGPSNQKRVPFAIKKQPSFLAVQAVEGDVSMTSSEDSIRLGTPPPAKPAKLGNLFPRRSPTRSTDVGRNAFSYDGETSGGKESVAAKNTIKEKMKPRPKPKLSPAENESDVGMTSAEPRSSKERRKPGSEPSSRPTSDSRNKAPPFAKHRKPLDKASKASRSNVKDDQILLSSDDEAEQARTCSAKAGPSRRLDSDKPSSRAKVDQRFKTAPFPMPPLDGSAASDHEGHQPAPYPMAREPLGGDDSLDDDDVMELNAPQGKGNKRALPVALTPLKPIAKSKQARPPQRTPFPMPTSKPATPENIRSYADFRIASKEASSDDEPWVSPQRSSTSSKRANDSDADNTRAHPSAKRLKKDTEMEKLSESLWSHSCVDGRSSSRSPSPEPGAELCPFCDEPFPRKPSRYLLDILQSLIPKSWASPRPSNPDGRDAPLAVSINLCATHRAESAVIPEGVKRGYPQKIDWHHVRSRVESREMKRHLLSLLDDRKGLFWETAKKDVEQRGTRVANSVQGQMGTFEMTQPGYYGERGYFIISNTLQDLFPAGTIDPQKTFPLEPSDFMRRVLLPEAALKLIMEDMKTNREEALEVYGDSRAYGLAAFPVRDGEARESLSMALSPQPPIRIRDSAKTTAVKPTNKKPLLPIELTGPKPLSKDRGKERARPASSALLDDKEEQEKAEDRISQLVKTKPTKAPEKPKVTKKPVPKPRKREKNLFDESGSDSDRSDSGSKQPAQKRSVPLTKTTSLAAPEKTPSLMTPTKTTSFPGRLRKEKPKIAPQALPLPPSDDEEEAYLAPHVVLRPSRKENTPPSGVPGPSKKYGAKPNPKQPAKIALGSIAGVDMIDDDDDDDAGVPALPVFTLPELDGPDLSRGSDGDIGSQDSIAARRAAKEAKVSARLAPYNKHRHATEAARSQPKFRT